MAAAMTHHKAASEPEECMKIAQLAVLEGVAPGIGTCFARVEIYKTKSLKALAASRRSRWHAPGAGSAVSGGVLPTAVRDAQIAIAREPAGRNDRYVIDLNTGKLHLCNAKNAIAVWPKRPIVSVQMNLQSGTASMLTRSGPFAV
jgi:hypothetical protein